MTQVTVVVGAQYGSEGKGAISAHITRSPDWDEQTVAIRVAGPNAGHTAYDKDGREWKLRALPVAAVVNSRCQLHIAAGSEVDLAVLGDEIDRVQRAGHKIENRLTIHPSATVLNAEHIARESRRSLANKIGSTGKGIGAARADRIWREALTFEQLVRQKRELAVLPSMTLKDLYWLTLLGEPGPFSLADTTRVLIEGTQGYGLGLHTENYPQVTSSDCRAIDFLAMAGISPWDFQVTRLRVVLVARTLPIRVAGNSGPMKGETDWATLGLPEERTTVTNKVRRVGAWDDELLAEAIRANGGGDYNPDVVLALTMLDHAFPAVREMQTAGGIWSVPGAGDMLTAISNLHGIGIPYVGTGPNTVVEASL